MEAQECYRILGMKQGCSWKEVRTTYQRLALRWHPDRHQQQAEAQQHAEQQMQLLNEAFTTLSTFYKKHGHLPSEPPPPPADRQPAPAETAKTETSPRPEATTGSRKKRTHRQASGKTHTRQNFRGVPWGVAVAMILAAYLFFPGFDQEENDRLLKQTNITPLQQTSPRQTTEPQDPKTPPQSTLGSPPQTGKNPSRQDHPAFDASAPLGMYGKKLHDNYFSYGDTPGKVFEVQGIPTRTVGDIWFYGQSEVHFNNGAVVSWYNSPGHPLRAK